MALLSYVVAILVFPAGAVWAWRRGRQRGLAFFTATAVGAIVVLALWGGSEGGGNRLVRTLGYSYTASRTLLLAGLALILPVVASAMSVWATGPRIRPGFVYPIAAATALIGTAVGSMAAIYAIRW
jgi:hypothetical protein